MRPINIGDFYDDYNLVVASVRARELEASWRSANFSRQDVRIGTNKPQAGVFREAREAAAHWLIGLGQKVFPGDIQLCD